MGVLKTGFRHHPIDVSFFSDCFFLDHFFSLFFYFYIRFFSPELSFHDTRWHPTALHFPRREATTSTPNRRLSEASAASAASAAASAAFRRRMPRRLFGSAWSTATSTRR